MQSAKWDFVPVSAHLGHVRQKSVVLNSVLVTDVDFFAAAWSEDFSGDQERAETHQTAI